MTGRSAAARKPKQTDSAKRDLKSITSISGALRLKDQMSVSSSKNNSFFEPPLPPHQIQYDSLAEQCGRKKLKNEKVAQMKDIKRYLDKFFRELKDLYRTIPQKITDDSANLNPV